jgi:hypothetical protein
MTIKNRKDKAEPLPMGLDFHKIVSNEEGYMLVQVIEGKDEAQWFKVLNPVVRFSGVTYLVMNTKQDALPVPELKSVLKPLKVDGKYVLCAANYHPAGTSRWYLLRAA